MSAIKEPDQPNMQPDPYIFVSYSHTIRKEAEQVIQTLQANGYRVWFDNGLIPGGSYNDLIARKIKGCKVFLCLLSEGYYDSSYCKQEFFFAKEEKDKPIIPVYVGKIQEIKASLPDGILMWLTGVHAIELTDDEEEFINNIEKLELLSGCKGAIPRENDIANNNKEPDTTSNDSSLENTNNDLHQQTTDISKPSAFRRNVVTAVVEVIVLLFAAIMMSRIAPERIDRNVILLMIFIFGSAIAIANIVDALNKMEWLSFILTSIVFILGLVAFEHFGNVPASLPFLILVGEGFALMHTVFSRVVVTVLGKNNSIYDYDEPFIDNPDSEDE